MNIGLNPARVDVNVHPAKLEVKFSNEKPVFEAIYYTVRQALEQDTGRPALKTEALKPTLPSRPCVCRMRRHPSRTSGRRRSGNGR